MPALIQFKSGLKDTMPFHQNGEGAFTSDTHEFYVGWGGVNYFIGPYTDEMAQDAIGNSFTNTSTVLFFYDDVNNQISASVKYQMSLVADSGGLKLQGDVTSPGNGYYYGTDGTGARNWIPFPVDSSQGFWRFDNNTAMSAPASGKLR